VSSAASWALAPFQDRSQPAAKSRGTAAQPASPTGHSAAYPTANNISISVPGFFHRQFRHASAPASLCLSSPSLHSLFIIPFAHSFIAPLFVPAACITRVHANHLPTSYSCLDLCPPTSAHPRLRHTRSLHLSIRDYETYTIVLITSIHDDRTRGGAAVHVAVGENSCVESAGCGKELERTTTTTTNHWQKTSSTSPRAQESTSASISRPDDEQPPNIYIWLFSVAADGQSSPWRQ
jgi:hypothetical protein